MFPPELLEMLHACLVDRLTLLGSNRKGGQDVVETVDHSLSVLIQEMQDSRRIRCILESDR